jgi:hypothetical protein
MTAIVDDLMAGIGAIIHPDKKTQKRMDIGDSLVMFYKFSAIPVILAFIIGLVSPLGATEAISAALALWIGIPVYIAITAALYHLLGKVVFKAFKNSYANNVTALVYGSFPLVLLYWLISLTSFGAGNAAASASTLMIFAILLVWGVFITIVALSNQQRCSRLTAFGVMIIIGILYFVVFLLLVGAVFYTLGSPGLQPGTTG